MTGGDRKMPCYTGCFKAGDPLTHYLNRNLGEEGEELHRKVAGWKVLKIEE